MTRPELSKFDGSLTVMEKGTYEREGKHFRMPLGDALLVKTDRLHDFCFSEVNPLSRDLSVVLGAIRCMDRSVRRLHGERWSRRLYVVMPVYELSTWREPAVSESLTEMLEYLTGDVWNINFVKRRHRPPPNGQAPLVSAPEASRTFIPFSHGLDSYAQGEIFKDKNESVDIVRIRLCATREEPSMRFLGRASVKRVTPIPVATSFLEPKHAEQSFRTRPFLFDMLAAYAAVLSGNREVLIPENGQGSLGGSLIRMGEEAPHRSCHPGFTTRLAKFIHSLTQIEIQFRHPALYQTKGQVLSALKSIRGDSESWLKGHSSCSYDSRHANKHGRQVHCGVCGNCLLRRMSLHAASIEDVTDYKVLDLHAGSLGEGVEANDTFTSEKAYWDLALNAARSMQRMADLPDDMSSSRVMAEAANLSRYQSRPHEDVKADLNGLLKQHRHEWLNFLAYCGKQSWVAKLAQG